MSNPIQFVSLGPGDPELVTLKALKILRQAEIIFCPATRGKQSVSSRATEILTALAIDSKTWRPFVLPMSKRREDARQVYDRLFEEARTAYDSGKRVAIVAEGDAGFYSSIQYIYERFRQAEIPVSRVAGIPAFIAAGALAGIHIAKQEEQINVIPGTASFEEIQEKIKEGTTIVVMKLSSCQEAIQACLHRSDQATDFHYFENIGTENEYYTHDVSTISGRNFPYFSLLIIQPRPAKNSQ